MYASDVYLHPSIDVHRQLFVCFGSSVAYVCVCVSAWHVCVCVGAKDLLVFFFTFFPLHPVTVPGSPSHATCLGRQPRDRPGNWAQSSHREFLKKITTKSKTRRRRRAPASMPLMPDCHRSHHDDSDTSRASAAAAAALAKALDGSSWAQPGATLEREGRRPGFKSPRSCTQHKQTSFAARDGDGGTQV